MPRVRARPGTPPWEFPAGRPPQTPGRGQTSGPQRQTKTPGGLQHRVEQPGPSAAVVGSPDGDEDESRYPLEVLGQMGCRCDHAFPSLAAATQALCSGNDAVATGLTVECGESRLDVRVTDDQPPAPGDVPTRRRLFRQVHT